MTANGSTATPPSSEPKKMKVVLAGGGIAGNVLLRQLQRRPDVSVKAYEKRSYEDASPPGLNVLMNHNGLAAMAEVDPELYQAFLALEGSPMTNWSARTMAGDVLYHLPDVVEGGDAAVPSLVARWDEIHMATRVDELTEYNVKVTRVEEEEGKETLTVHLLRLLDGAQVADSISGVDLLIAADGRYSTIREQLAPSPTYFGPPYVADFRIVADDCRPEDIALLTDDEPMWRVYNKPNASLFDPDSHPTIMAAASGYVRVGLMKLGETTMGLFGNIPLPGEGELTDDIKAAAILTKLFQPADGSAPDHMGKIVLNVLGKHGDDAHWARKQQTETCYSALGGRVLFIGDAAGAIYPSLGQGANLSLEDAAVAAAAFPDVATIERLRHPRRQFIKEISRQHAMHVSFPEKFEEEVTNWREASSAWRADLRRLWCPGSQLAIRATTATPESFAPYGQLIAESLDGDLYDPIKTDAALDLSQGTPRFYLMKLTGGRPMRADRITRHKKVTQCLGALGLSSDFYLVVHEATDNLTLAGLKAFRIPPCHFVKLRMGTWHVGPMWTGSDLDRTFMNLELTDTNEVDHDTVEFYNLLPGGESVLMEEEDKIAKLEIPVLPVFE